MNAVVKYPDSTKTSLQQRVGARARQRWPEPTRVEVRHRGAFSYLDGVLPDGSVLKLCRLRYIGSAHDWHFAIYRASHQDYEESIFPTGLPIGTCEDALDTACALTPGRPHRLDLTPGRTYGRDHLRVRRGERGAGHRAGLGRAVVVRPRGARRR